MTNVSPAATVKSLDRVIEPDHVSVAFGALYTSLFESRTDTKSGDMLTVNISKIMRVAALVCLTMF